MHNTDSPEQQHVVDQSPDKHKIKIGTGPITFQARVDEWMQTCFGAEISADRTERNHRFLEEALELAQANHCTESEAHQLVDYVFGRPVGHPVQEVGGVLLTLAALCTASHVIMELAGEIELVRVWTKVEQIRAKNAAKPKHSPLPGPSVPAAPSPDDACRVTVGGGLSVYGSFEAIRRVQDYILLDSSHPVEKEDVRRSLAIDLQKAEIALVDVMASLAAAISLLERSPKTAAPSNKMFDQMLIDYRASLDRARAAIGGA